MAHDVTVGDGAFHELWYAAAAGAPGRPALAAGNRTLRYAEVDALVGRVAAALVRDGVRTGARVLLALPPGVHLVAGALAALRVGAVVVPLDPARGADHAARVAEAMRPAVTVAATEAAAAVAEVTRATGSTVVEARAVDAAPRLLRLLARLAQPARVLQAPPRGCVRWSRWVTGAAAADFPSPGPDDEALVGVAPDGDGRVHVFRHRALCFGAEQLRAWVSDALPGAETWLVLAPLASPSGFVAALGTVPLLRARLALVPTAAPEHVLDALRYLRPTHVFSAREQVASLLGVRGLLGADVRSVRTWLVSDPLSGELVEQFEGLAGVSPCQGLAVACSAGLVACNPVNGRRVPGSVGVPMPGTDVRLTGPAGTSDRGGSLGLLQVRAPNVVPVGAWCGTGLTAGIDDAGFVRLVTPLAGDPAPGRATATAAGAA